MIDHVPLVQAWYCNFKAFIGVLPCQSSPYACCYIPSSGIFAVVCSCRDGCCLVITITHNTPAMKDSLSTHVSWCCERNIVIMPSFYRFSLSYRPVPLVHTHFSSSSPILVPITSFLKIVTGLNISLPLSLPNPSAPVSRCLSFLSPSPLWSASYHLFPSPDICLLDWTPCSGHCHSSHLLHFDGHPTQSRWTLMSRTTANNPPCDNDVLLLLTSGPACSFGHHN